MNRRFNLSSTNRKEKGKGFEAANAVIELFKNDPKVNKNSLPRVKIIQKIYGSLMNPDAEILYPEKSI